MLKDNNIVFYSCIVRNRDKPKVLEFKENFRYVLFSDVQYQIPDWEILPLAEKFRDPVRTARFHKHNPFLLFPNAKYTIWIDGTHWPISTIKNLLKDDFSLMKHFARDNIFQEKEECKIFNLDKHEILEKQYLNYIEDGFLDNKGLYDTCFMIRKKTEKMIEMQNFWWNQICKWSKRDQISLPYVLWKCGIQPSVIPGYSRVKYNSFLKMISHYDNFNKIM